LGRLDARWTPATTLARVQAAWPQVTGEAVARAARPTAERDGKLTVGCDEAVWAQELTLMAPVLCERLNEALGEALITEIRCRIG
jgi:predicted nucleic acid-binding Zn ribbon protein